MVEVEKMTETEKLAYKWILSQGYKPEEVSFYPRRHIDFIVAGKPYEVKKLNQNTIYTTEDQYKELKNPNVTILVFAEEQEPIFVGPLSELEKKFKVYITIERLRSITVRIEEGVLEWLADQVRAGRFASIAHGIRYALKKLMEGEGERNG